MTMHPDEETELDAIDQALREVMAPDAKNRVYDLAAPGMISTVLGQVMTRLRGAANPARVKKAIAAYARDQGKTHGIITVMSGGRERIGRVEIAREPVLTGWAVSTQCSSDDKRVLRAIFFDHRDALRWIEAATDAAADWDDGGCVCDPIIAPAVLSSRADGGCDLVSATGPVEQTSTERIESLCRAFGIHDPRALDRLRISHHDPK